MANLSFVIVKYEFYLKRFHNVSALNNKNKCVKHLKVKGNNMEKIEDFIDNEKLFKGYIADDKIQETEIIITKDQFLMAFNNWILPYINNDLLR